MTYAFTPESLADRWEVCPATVRNLVRQGALRAFRIGRQIRIRPEAVEEYECRNGGSNSTEEVTPQLDPMAAEPSATPCERKILMRPRGLSEIGTRSR